MNNQQYQTSGQTNPDINIMQSDNYGRHTEDNVSFRGQPIPEVFPKVSFQVADSQMVIDKIVSMTEEERRNVTIDAVHFDRNRLTNVRLTTGDIIPVETAIGLAQSGLLYGYSTGSTTRGGKTLRSKPDPRNKNSVGIYQLPRF